MTSGLADDRRRLDDLTLRAACNNAASGTFTLAVFCSLVVVLLRTDVSSGRLTVWLCVSAGAIALTSTVAWLNHSAPADRPLPRSLTPAARAALIASGVVFGLAPWLGMTAELPIAILFSSFPAIAAVIGVVITAGRVDLFACHGIPIFVGTFTSLLIDGRRELQIVAALSVFLGAQLPFVHRAVSRSLRTAIRLQTETESLLAQSAADRTHLAALNERLADSNAQLQVLAYNDPLTGLLNRRGALERLDETMGSADCVSVLFCDLDRFKAVNDMLGHRGGDQFLLILADRIRRSLEPPGFVGRIGGDEFIVVLPGGGQAEAVSVASRVVGVVSQPVHAEGRDCPSSVSIGIATAPADGDTVSELLRNANAALFHAKTSGRNRFELFDGAMSLELSKRLTDEQELRTALDHQEIMPFFQPELDATSGALVGAELLARWVHADGRIIAAGEFIQLARQAGLIERLTEQVVAGARRQINRMATLGLPNGFRFRINVSSDKNDRAWHENSIELLTAGIDPNLVTVDIREGAVADNLIGSASALAAFRAQGGRVCLDDFGRGVSSLSTLRRLPLDEVCIDQVALDSLTNHPHDRAIVRSIIALARELGLSVTADGVETASQADALIALGCVRHQGHLYSPALMADDFEAFVLARLAEQYNSGPTTDPWDTIS
jgi:diguanylate cyclase (GGDEF)-like protein